MKAEPEAESSGCVHFPFATTAVDLARAPLQVPSRAADDADGADENTVSTVSSVSDSGSGADPEQQPWGPAYPGITVNAVAPGFVRTDMTLGGRGATDWQGTEERFAARAMMARIGEPEGWITAQVLTVDGGRMDYIGHG